MIICPRCFGTDISMKNDSIYVCNNDRCYDENNKPTEFIIIEDDEIKFPYNQVYTTRSVGEFCRKSYINNM